jgi:hypothetical protein
MVVWFIVIFAGLFAHIYHAVVAAIVTVAVTIVMSAATANLRDRVVGTDLPPGTVVVVLANASLVVVLDLPRITINNLGSLNHLVFGLVYTPSYIKVNDCLM